MLAHPPSSPPPFEVTRHTREPNVDVPEWVKATRDDGVEDVSLELASQFYQAHRSLCHRTQRRGELSKLYLSTFKSWASQEVQADRSKQRQFKQVLYAMSRGLGVLRVVDEGRRLLWKANRPRQDDRRDAGRRYDDRRDAGRRYDDRRDAGRRYDDRRDAGRRYDDRRDAGRRYDDRRDAGRRYDDRRDSGRRYDDRRDLDAATMTAVIGVIMNSVLMGSIILGVIKNAVGLVIVAQPHRRKVHLILTMKSRHRCTKKCVC